MKAQHLTEAQLLTAIDLFNKGHKLTYIAIHHQSREGNMIIYEEVEEAVKGDTGTQCVSLGILGEPDYHDNNTVINVVSGYYAPDGTYLGKF